MTGQIKVLVVDDLEDFAWIISQALSEQRYKILMATTGRDALTTIKRDNPQIMVLDMRLPDMEGIEILKRAKKIKPKIAVIILTAYASTNLRKEAQAAGVFDFISKPAKIDKLVTIIEKAAHQVRKAQ